MGRANKAVRGDTGPRGISLVEAKAESIFDRAKSLRNRDRLPFGFAQSKKVVLLSTESDTPKVLSVNWPSLDLYAELKRVIGRAFLLEIVSEEEFQAQVSDAYQRDNAEAHQVAEDLSADIDLGRLAEEIPDSGDLADAEDDAPVIRLINAILSQAIRDKASDVHLETFEDRLSVRYRIDGVLTEVLTPRKMLSPLLVSRLKVMAKLDIAEKRLPQDGRISVRIAGHAIDMRMSTIPSAHGERVVLRLLDKESGRLELPQLTMPQHMLDSYQNLLSRPHGIILVTGPTGSGKTTTLYAGLSYLNQAVRNILTIEDPIEYSLPGIGQTQVNQKVDMTFARGLRAILRQDPDVVMVGEIRDVETAKIAVQASLTGHLVLSTLHTNTAIGAIGRLRDMGIEPFLMSSSLIGVMAQRLVRLLCVHCKESRYATESECQLFDIDYADHLIFAGRGCDQCHHSGYKGRAAIYEFIDIDQNLQSLIHEAADDQTMRRSVEHRCAPIRKDGVRRVLAGETSVEEVLRVTSEI